MAWNVEWSDSRRLLTLLRPHELAKYNASNQRDYGTAGGRRDFESGVNLLERLTGLDIDRDGDVGVTGKTGARAATAPAPAVAVRQTAPAPASGSARVPAAAAQHTGDTSTPLSSYRKASFTPISRNHHTPKEELHKNRVGGIMPYYMGHVPNNHVQFGIATVGGIHPEPSGPYDA